MRLPHVLLLVLVLVLPTISLRAEEEAGGSAADGAIVLCEVWRVTSGMLVEQIEKMSESAPDDADGVRDVLRGAEDGCDRVARFLTPIALGTPLRLRAMHQVPQMTSGVETTGGSVRSGFAGFVEVGTKLDLRCDAEGEAFSSHVQLDVSGTGEPAGEGLPPQRYSASLQATLRSSDGGMCMYQSNTHGAETLVVFVRVRRP